MKKKFLLLGMMMLVILIGIGVTFAFNNGKKDSENQDLTFTIVTSFYPMYIAAENIVDGAENLELINLTEKQEGCLHDYQLTTSDMKKLEDADVFIMNGGGMEHFIEKIVKAYPHIQVIDASSGIDLLDVESEHHHEGAEEANKGVKEKNAHIWMNPEKHIKQIENITRGICKADASQAEIYKKNSLAYITKLEGLVKELEQMDMKNLGTGIISFHDAFAYLAEILGIPVIHSVVMDKDTALSAGEVAEVIDEAKENNVKYIFTEKQLSESSPKRVAEETGAKLCIIDSLVSGGIEKNAYIEGMKRNIEMLKQVVT
ncbi:MAG: metal ABC transporter substrate-binding protein, partial [Acetivibrio sp.]